VGDRDEFYRLAARTTSGKLADDRVVVTPAAATVSTRRQCSGETCSDQLPA
jgi:hypothetical protein